MSGKSKFIKIGILLGIVVICASGFAWKQASSSAKQNHAPVEIVRPVKTIRLAKKMETKTRSFPGIVQADKEVKLSFRVGGPLIDMEMEIGQQINKGDVIAKIDPRDFKIQLRKLQAGIQEATSNLKVMKKGARQEDLEQLQANLRASQARLLEAQLNFDRYKNLYEQQAASKSRFDSAKAAHEMAQAQVDAATQALKKARQGARIEDVEAMEAHIAVLKSDLHSARNALEDTVLRAPFSGFIHEKRVENHETVQPGQTIVSILDVGSLEIHSAIPEEMVFRKNDFSTVTCEFEAIPDRKFEATVDYIGKTTNKANQSYPIALIIERPEGSITPGMAATVTIQLKNQDVGQNRFSLPVSAVFADESGIPHVWVLNMRSMTVHKTRVKIKGLSNDHIQLISGAEPGTRIVTAGAKFLRDGQKVSLITNPEEAS